jgi:hypothetical protein
MMAKQYHKLIDKINRESKNNDIQMEVKTNKLNCCFQPVPIITKSNHKLSAKCQSATLMPMDLPTIIILSE